MFTPFLPALFQDRFTSFVPALSKYGSATVGGTLLAIGAVGLYETWAAASEAADADAAAAPPPPPTTKPGSSGWTLAAGVVYGLQPDALLTLLPALALSRPSAVAYLATYMFGTVLAMASYTAFIGAGTEQLRRRAPGVTRRISLFSALLAVVIGCLLGVEAAWPGTVPLFG